MLQMLVNDADDADDDEMVLQDVDVLAMQIIIDDEEVGEVIVTVDDDVDANEYLYLDIQALVDITLLEELKHLLQLVGLHIVYIHLLQMEL